MGWQLGTGCGLTEDEQVNHSVPSLGQGGDVLPGGQQEAEKLSHLRAKGQSASSARQGVAFVSCVQHEQVTSLQVLRATREGN